MHLSCKTLVLRGAFCVVLLASGCGEPARSPSERTAPATAPTTTPALSPAPRASADSATYVFNIPARIGLRADQIKATLGKPISDERESIDELVKSLIYRRQGYELLIDYKVRSRQVINFYLSPTKSWKKYAYFLTAGNLNQEDKHYKVDLLNEENGLYQGVVVTPDSAALAAQR